MWFNSPCICLLIVDDLYFVDWIFVAYCVTFLTVLLVASDKATFHKKYIGIELNGISYKLDC